jgi:hypothetical protein
MYGRQISQPEHSTIDVRGNGSSGPELGEFIQVIVGWFDRKSPPPAPNARLHAECRLGSLRTIPKVIPEKWQPGFGIV